MTDGSDLDPEIRHFIRSVTAATAAYPEFADGSRSGKRQVAEKVRAMWARGGPQMLRSEDRLVETRSGDVPLRIHRATPEVSPALVYLHGGGWTMFSVNTHDRLMREYAARAGCTVVGVDYALSPEARYPTALHQVIDVVRWTKLHGESVGIDASRIAIGGDSAGANLAIASCLGLRDSAETRLPIAMILNYGAYAAECSTEACRRFGGDAYMLSCEEMSGFWRDYLRRDSDTRDAAACPLLAKLEGLPPAFLAIAECDILAEQNLHMAGRLRDAGVSVTAKIYRGASHSFLEAVGKARVSDRALNDAASWLRNAFEPASESPGESE